MAMKAKHAFGNLADVQKALDSGKINSYDILFLDGDTAPKIGWIDANKVFRLVENETDFSELETIIAKKADAEEVEAKLAKKADASEVEAAIATKADTADVKAKVGQAVTDANAYTDKMVEAAMGEHLTKKYEIADVPDGTLVDYRENEIRVMCKADAVFTKQNVGAGGNANNYYMTFKTYAPDGAVGYIEHLGNQVDEEVLTDLKTDDYGRKYQPTWLGIAVCNESTGEWTYYGKNSTANKYIGWDYQIDWFDANGVMIASDSVRINLSNENCHYEIKPYYVGTMMTEIDTKIEEKIKEVDSSYEIVEF